MMQSTAVKSMRRIRIVVLLLLGLTFLAVAAIRIIVLYDHRDQVLEQSRARAQNLASLVADNLSQTIEMIDGSLLRISQHASQLKGTDSEIQLATILEQSLSTMRGISAITILDAQGVISHSTMPQIIGESRADRPLYSAMLMDRKTDLVADAPFESRVSAQLLFPLGRRITTPSGDFLGIVAATLELERLREFYRSFRTGQKGVIWVLHPDGHVLFRQPHGQHFVHRLEEGHALLTLPTVFTSNAVHAGPLDNSGVRYLTAFRKIQTPSIRIAVSLSEDEVLEPWWKEFHLSLLVLFGTALAIGLAGLQVHRQIGARLQQAEDYLIKTQQFRDILDHAPVTITVKDIDGRITLANRDFLNRIGRTQSEVIGTTLEKVLPQRYADELKLLDEEVVRTKSMIQREIRWDQPRIHMSTKFPLLDSKGEVEAVGSISLDITESKAAQTINLSIFEKSLDIILVCDSQGNLSRVSPSVTAILGYKPEELEGRNAVNFIHPDDLQSTRDEMRALRIEKVSRNFNSRYFHKDGRVISLAWTGMWVEDEQLHLFIGHDLTEQAKLEAELRQSQKMEAIGRLTGGLAHDYNNLLTVILGNAELLVEALRGNAALTPMAQSVLDAANRSAVLTQRLLAFGRRQALESEPIDVSSLVREMTDLVRFTAGEGVRLDFALDTDPWIVSVDRNQLETAVLNLVVNARDAMGRRGVLRIETAKAEFGESVSIVPDMKDGNYMMLAVTDNGSGMSPEVLSRVFEPFFTTKEVGKGTGLGLSMVYGFVKQSGGHVAIYSEPGHGTAVKIFFPTTDRRISEDYDSERRDKANDLPMGTESILVVEDDALVRDNTQRQLLSLGYRVLVVGSGREALRQLGVGYRPDLLLTDVILGGEMNGKELADKVRVLDPGIRVMFMSGYTSGVLADPATGVIPESMNFIGKPFRRSQLARSVRDALESEMTELA